LNAQLPPSFRQFLLVFPNRSRATFRDSDGADGLLQKEEVIGGKGCHLIKSDDGANPSRSVGLIEAVERLARKRSYDDDGIMRGIETRTESANHTPPPRKKAKAVPVLPKLSTVYVAAPPSPLPSPHGSLPPLAVCTSQWSLISSTSTPIQPDVSLATLTSLPSLTFQGPCSNCNPTFS
jgi:F-box and WD-40 domain protein CDC4